MSAFIPSQYKRCKERKFVSPHIRTNSTNFLNEEITSYKGTLWFKLTEKESKTELEKQMLKQPGLKSSGLYISVFQDRPDEGAFFHISDKPWVYTDRNYFSNIIYAPNLTKVGSFKVGSFIHIRQSWSLLCHHHMSGVGMCLLLWVLCLWRSSWVLDFLPP